MKIITTSWDHGHPIDFKLAELLCKYNIAGTFYIAKNNNEHIVMDESMIFQIAEKFEIGSHTLNHVRLSSKSIEFVDSETKGCYQWLSNILSQKPISFCFRGGVYSRRGVESAKRAGFQLLRTTELLSTALPRRNNIIPTKIQTYNHSSFTYLKHLSRRLKFQSMLFYLKKGCSSSLEKLTESYINEVISHGGCFHLWGHSWEIEEYDLWEQLERLLKIVEMRQLALSYRQKQKSPAAIATGDFIFPINPNN